MDTGRDQEQEIRISRIHQTRDLTNSGGKRFSFVGFICYFNILYPAIIILRAAVSLQLLQGFPCFSQVTKQTASLEIYKDKDTGE